MANFLEQTLEDIIVENSQIIHNRGFQKMYKCLERQFRLPSGKIIDILTWEIRGDVIYAKIIELKRGVCDESAFWQGLAYLEEFMLSVIQDFSNFDIRLIVCGDSVVDNLGSLIFIDSNVKFYSYKYDYDGIRFNTNESDASPIRETQDGRRVKLPSSSPSAGSLGDRLREIDIRVDMAKANQEEV